jgi:hypothetical protein
MAFFINSNISLTTLNKLKSNERKRDERLRAVENACSSPIEVVMYRGFDFTSFFAKTPQKLALAIAEQIKR